MLLPLEAFALQHSTVAARFLSYLIRAEAVMDIEFTAVFQKVPEGYIAFVEELSGANTQGRTMEEARENLQEAITLVLDANRAVSEETLKGQDVIRESFRIRAV
jgi:predicted RNase H-like HicB family nuclease